MNTKEKEKYLPKRLITAFSGYVANDESWSEPKKVFISRKEFSQFPFKGKVQQLYEKLIEMVIDDNLRTFTAIKHIEIVPGQGRKKETHITLSDDFWTLVNKLRALIPD